MNNLMYPCATEVRIVETVADIASIRSLWNDLQQDKNTVFSDIDYYYGLFQKCQQHKSHEFYGSTPYIVIFCRSDKPVAGILARRCRYSPKLTLGYFSINLPYLECLQIEMGGLICAQTDDAHLIQKHLESLMSSQAIELLKFDYLSQSDPFWKILIKDIQLDIKPIIDRRVEWLIRLADPHTGQCLIQKPKGRTAKRMRAAERKLHKQFSNQVKIVCFTHPSDVDVFLQQAEEISEHSYQHALDVGVRHNAAWSAELKLLANAGYLRAYILYGNHQAIGYNVGVSYRGLFTGYAMAFDQRFHNLSPGKYLLRNIIENLFLEGIHTFHFGFGDAIYKKNIGAELIEGASLQFYAKNFRAMLIHRLVLYSLGLEQSIKSILQKIGLLSQLKKFWRQYLTSKI